MKTERKSAGAEERKRHQYSNGLPLVRSSALCLVLSALCILLSALPLRAWADTTPPVISLVAVASGTISAIVSWVTDVPADSQVEYGTTSGYGSMTTLEGIGIVNIFSDIKWGAWHSQTLTGLTPNTVYNFRVRSKDAAGNLAVSDNVTFKTSSLVTTSPGTNALAALAESMAPGTFATLQTDGWDNGLVEEPCRDASSVLEYTNQGGWDPVSEEFIFQGGAHGYCMASTTIIYHAKTNMWEMHTPPGNLWAGPNNLTIIPNVPAAVYHSYHLNAFDPVNGSLFYGPLNGNKYYRFDLHGARTWTEHSTITPIPLGRATFYNANIYFPERHGLLHVDGSEGVYFYSDTTGQWKQIANTQQIYDPSLPTLLMGSYENFTTYDPVYKIVLFGGGALQGVPGTAKIIYKMDAAGTITRMKDAPVDNAFGATVSHVDTVDPVSGNILDFMPDGSIWEYNPMADTWNLMPYQHHLAAFPGTSNAGFQLAAAPITNCGVIMFVVDYPWHSIILYRHSPAPVCSPPVVCAPPPGPGCSYVGGNTCSCGTLICPDAQPPTVPSGLGASGTSSSQIQLSWNASTDNVGVQGYRIYRQDKSGLLNTATGTSYTDSGLSANTSYSYRVSALDAAGNESGQSSPATATTLSTAGPASLTLLRPATGSTVSGPDVVVVYAKSGDLVTAGVDHIQLQLDSNPEIRDADFDGTYTFTSVALGTHALKAYLAKIDNTKVSGTDASVSFTVVASSSPGTDSLRLDLPATLRLNATIAAHVPPSWTVTRFEWSFTAANVSGGNRERRPSRAAASGSLLKEYLSPTSSMAAALDGSLSTLAATMSLASLGLTPGKYTITVTAFNGTTQLGSASATTTLVQSDLSAVKVYPNPWRKDRHDGKKVTFINLPTGSTVKLFTTSGHQVKSLNETNGQVQWDLTNDSGDKIASGIYMYLITANEGQKVKGKFAVIK